MKEKWKFVIVGNNKEKWNFVIAGKWMEHHIKWGKPGSERQRSHVFSHMWKINQNVIISILYISSMYRTWFQ
jgi:hypothetical protein